jgi:predicted component of type VI protein secretion system
MEATPELLECIYSFLVKNGHEAVAKSLAEEAKLDKKKLKKAVTKDLSEIFSASLK